jgi:GT2 family glycosyltransferase
VIEQTLIKLRMALTPPGSLRERVVWAPIRTAQIINTEGFPGMARRLRDSLKHSKNSAPEPLLLQQSSQTGAGGNFPRRRTSMPSLAETGFGNTYSQNEPLIFDTSRQTVQISRSSIIILTHNNLNYTRLCLDSIFDHTSGMDFEVIIVDNGSSDGTQDYLASLAAAHKKQPKLPVLKVIQNQENQGFARGNNQGAAAADGDILVFLNNDTIVTPGWLPGLVKYLRFPEIGMVGPVTNSSGNESRIETEYRNLEEMQTFARAYTQQHDGEAFEIGMLAFLCVGIRRSVYQEIGALDERFGLGMFEDDDYAIRVRKNNYHIICAQDVFIHHWGSASFSRLPSKDFYRIFNKNHKKFEEKWGDQWIK